MAVNDTKVQETSLHTLKATSKTVHWGYFDNSVKPALEINSGDIVSAETVTHQAGDAPDLMMDDGIKEIYDNIPFEQRIPGAHIMTGPIYVKDATPGDMLQVEILQLTPRLPYGANLLANWGFLFNEFDKKERITIYELDREGKWLNAKFAYDYPYEYNINGRIIAPEEAIREPALTNMQIPARLHIGNMGVAPKEKGCFSSTPPGMYGGNIDNWKIGAGATIYYPVGVEGALLSLGDGHFAQGDSELSGTAVEASLNCLLKINVRKDMAFHSPLLETTDAWITHGFHPDLEQAAKNAALEMVGFLSSRYGLSRQDAYSLISVCGDFSITQVVDENKGIHVSIPKSVLLPKA